MTTNPWDKLHEIFKKDLQEVNEALSSAIEAQNWEDAMPLAEAAQQVQEVVMMLTSLEVSGDLPRALKCVAAYVEAKKDKPE